MILTERAYAKINLFLDVTGRREDGYHEIVTLMHSVSLCDRIRINASFSDKRSIVIRSNNKSLKNDESNLIYKSALKYMLKFDINAKIKIDLRKIIPIGAGLGGGSSDAAAMLRAMNRIFKRADEGQLLSIAAEIGSDVPFCLVGGCALCSGRGEKIEPARINISPYLVIAIGESRVSTPEAYAMLDEKYQDFKKYNEEKGFYASADAPLYYNIFQSVINNKEIEAIKAIMHQGGAENTLMSGSGPSVVGVFSSPRRASLVKRALKRKGFLAFRCILK